MDHTDPLLLGKTFYAAKSMDLPTVVSLLRYYAGWADKIQGKSIQVCLSRIVTHNPLSDEF